MMGAPREATFGGSAVSGSNSGGCPVQIVGAAHVGTPLDGAPSVGAEHKERKLPHKRDDVFARDEK
jgi:hypothetical protein